MEPVELPEHESPIKTPRQFFVAIVLAFVAPVVVILMLIHLVTGGLRVDTSSNAMSEEAVAKRLKPVGELVFAGSGSTQAAAPAAGGAAPAAAAPASAGAKDGKQVYQMACQACHGAGVAGAPKLGDKALWQPRIATGIAALYNSGLKGKNLMPAKGGNAALSDAEVKAAVDYIVSQSR